MSTSDVVNLASTAHRYHDGGGGWVFGLFFLLLFAALVTTVVWTLLRRGGGVRSDPADSARRILAERFARGEIDEQEYRSRISQLT